MKNRRKIKGEYNLRYNLTICKKNDAFDILNDISSYVTLVQLMDTRKCESCYQYSRALDI